MVRSLPSLKSKNMRSFLNRLDKVASCFGRGMRFTRPSPFRYHWLPQEQSAREAHHAIGCTYWHPSLPSNFHTSPKALEPSERFTHSEHIIAGLFYILHFLFHLPYTQKVGIQHSENHPAKTFLFPFHFPALKQKNTLPFSALDHGVHDSMMFTITCASKLSLKFFCEFARANRFARMVRRAPLDARLAHSFSFFQRDHRKPSLIETFRVI